MKDIVRSLTQNYKQLLKTVVLTIIVLYIYSFVAFSYFPQDFSHEESSDYKNYCETLFMCFVSTLFNGVRADGGIGDAIGNISKDSDHYWFRLFYDLTFFILVSICLMNIVFGTIIDAFATLRDKRKEKMSLISNKCFVCELDKHILESSAEGWHEHIHKNHNLNSYLRFFIFLERKPINDCNGIEKFVKQEIEKGEYNFVPYLDCINLRNKVVE